MSDLTLAHELALLAYDDEGRNRLESPRLDYGIAGAVLLELALAGRVEVVDDRVVVTDPTPVGQPVLDTAIARIDAETKRRRPKHWIGQLGKDAREQVLDDLVDAGVLRREADRVLGLFPRTRFPSESGVEPVVEAEARQRMRAAVLADGPVAERTAALIAIVQAVGLDRKVFQDIPKDRVRSRLKEIGEGSWASAATKKAIEEMYAAVVVTLTAAIVATTTTS